MKPESLSRQYDPVSGALTGAGLVERRLRQLTGCFADDEAFRLATKSSDPLVYQVASIEPGSGPGDLHYGLGVLHPGRVGDEYFMTKGHLHAMREAAEVYIGLRGEGFMLLEHEHTGESRLEPLGAGRIVYVPGHWAHRTMNTGETPLAYIGVYPALAGHDYGAIARRNFRKVLVAGPDGPTLRDRV